MVGSKPGPSAEHSTLRHLSDSVFAGGNVHGVFQQHSHHHAILAHSCLYGEYTVYRNLPNKFYNINYIHSFLLKVNFEADVFNLLTSKEVVIMRGLCSQATTIGLHPLYVMLPCTISASLAFMLPVATPPNAIAFSYGNLKVLDMVWLTTFYISFDFHCIIGKCM